VINVRTRVSRGSRSTRVLAGASTIAVVLGVTAAAPTAAAASTSIASLPTSYVVNGNDAGGVGDVRASWRNDGDPISRISLTVPAPSGFYFQRAGKLTIYRLDGANNVWRGEVGPDIAASCLVTDGGTLIHCDSIAVSIQTGTSFVVRFPTYIARSAPVTGAKSSEPGPTALLTIGDTRVESPIATSVSGVAGFEMSTAIPTTGSQRVSGTADPGTTVIVQDKAGNELGSGMAETDGTWQVTLHPGHGPIRTTFQLVDGATIVGPSAYYNSYIFSVSSPAAGADWSESPSFAGVGQPGSSVSIRDASDHELANGEVGPSGSWSLLPSRKLKSGAQDLRVVNTISDGSATTVRLTGVVMPQSSPSGAGAKVKGAAELDLAVTVIGGGAVANGESVRIIRVIVTDRAKPVAGARVRFATPGGFSLSNATALTNLQGEAFTTITATHTRESKVSVTVGSTTATAPLRFVSR
jgi:Big-like domain-containing protein